MASTPQIITAKELGLTFQNLFGPLGPEYFLTLHHTAGPTDDNLSEAMDLARGIHRMHRDQGWGGAGYHFMLPRTRFVIICLRPVTLKGAHVGLHNSNNVGVVCNGTTGDHPTKNQLELFEWLLRNAHRSRRLPTAHKTDRPLRKPYTVRRGHHDWPGHKSNACPGTHEPLLQLQTR